MKTLEIWKPITGCNGLYEISNQGNIKTLHNRGRTYLKQQTTWNKYKRIRLRKDEHVKDFAVHRLVALHFIPNPLNLPEVNHLDGDKSNNNDWNLEWSSKRNNINHAMGTGLVLKGEDSPVTNLTEKDVREMVEFFRQGIPTKYLIKKYNITLSTITGIVGGNSWQHLNLGINYRNVTYRISIETIEAVQKLLAKGLKLRVIARELNVTRETIRKIKNNEYKDFQDCIRQYFSD